MAFAEQLDEYTKEDMAGVRDMRNRLRNNGGHFTQEISDWVVLMAAKYSGLATSKAIKIIEAEIKATKQPTNDQQT